MLRKLTPAILALFLTAWASFAITPVALAQSNIIGGGVFGDVKVAGGTPFAIAQTSVQSTVAGVISTNTFSALPIGAANATRIVSVAVCHGAGAATLSAFTIGGVTAAQVSGSSFNSGAGVKCETWTAAVPTGTTATVQFDQSAADTRIVLGVYRVVGTGLSVSTGGGALSAPGVTTLSGTVTIPAGGGAIAFLMTHGSTSGSGTPTNLTLDTNNLVTGSSSSYIGNNTSSSGSTSIGVSWTNAVDAALTIVTFNP